MNQQMVSGQTPQFLSSDLAALKKLFLSHENKCHQEEFLIWPAATKE